MAGFAKYTVDVNLFRLGSSIVNHAGSRGVGLVGAVGSEAPPPVLLLKISGKNTKSVQWSKLCMIMHSHQRHCYPYVRLQIPIENSYTFIHENIKHTRI